MKENNVVELSVRVEADALTAMLRAGAEPLMRQAVDAELQELLASHAARVTDGGRAAVVRNGYLPARQPQSDIGPVVVKVPKVRAKTGEPVTFRSALVPPYVRKTRTLEAALPWLYLKGVSSGEMGEARQVGGTRGRGALGEHSLAVEAGLGAGISGLEYGQIRPRPLGLRVGGRCLQWAARRADEAVRAGGDWRE